MRIGSPVRDDELEVGLRVHFVNTGGGRHLHVRLSGAFVAARLDFLTAPARLR